MKETTHHHPAPVPRRIFICWFGSATLPKPRQRSFDAFLAMDCEIIRISENTFSHWIVPEHPIPEAWNYLHAVHKTNYMISYLMHFHGGGHADVKPPTGSWVPCFAPMDAPGVWAAGYQEDRWRVASLGVSAKPRYQPWNRRWWTYRWLQLNHGSLIGNCGFIFRPGTSLTSAWLRATDEVVALNAQALKRNPGRYAKEYPGETYRGVASSYPIPYTALAGDIMQPLIWKYRRHVIQCLPKPDIENYQ